MTDVCNQVDEFSHLTYQKKYKQELFPKGQIFQAIITQTAWMEKYTRFEQANQNLLITHDELDIYHKAICLHVAQSFWLCKETPYPWWCDGSQYDPGSLLHSRFLTHTITASTINQKYVSHESSCQARSIRLHEFKTP